MAQPLRRGQALGRRPLVHLPASARNLAHTTLIGGPMSILETIAVGAALNCRRCSKTVGRREGKVIRIFGDHDERTGAGDMVVRAGEVTVTCGCGAETTFFAES